MSVVDKLNEVQQARQSKYSKALRKSPTEQAAAYLAEASGSPTAVKPQSWMFKGILALLAVLILAVGLVIGLLLRNSSPAKNEAKPAVQSSPTAKPVTKAKAKAATKAKTTSTSTRRTTSK